MLLAEVPTTTEAIAAGAVIIVVVAFIGVIKYVFDKLEKKDALFCTTVESVHKSVKDTVESVHVFCNKQVENLNAERAKEREADRKDFSDMRAVVSEVRPRKD